MRSSNRTLRGSVRSSQQTLEKLSEVKSKTQSLRKMDIVHVDVVVAGGGPATLGLLCNAAKTNRLKTLITQGNGIAVLEKGYTLGGGNLQHYIINSNTSADGFLQCLYGDQKKAPAKRSKSIAAKKDGQQMAMAAETMMAMNMEGNPAGQKKRSNSADKDKDGGEEPRDDVPIQEKNELEELFKK